MNTTAAAVHFLPQPHYEQLETRFDSERGILWGFMNPSPRPTFNTQLLAELRSYVDGIVESGGLFSCGGHRHALRYAVIASSVPGVFNLGGDLALFRDAIKYGDRGRLIEYGRKCIDNLYPWSRNCDLPLTTIALIQGDALGGGFECALSSTVLIAEESSRMGFPEILFNLFPGMGAYSFLARKAGRRITEEVLTSGIMYTARQLYDMGVVDVVAPDRAGQDAVHAFVRKHSRCSNGRRSIETVRRELDPITYEELMRVVGIWADAALRLDERDIRMMDRLVRAQNRGADAECVTASVTPLQRAG